MSLQGPAEPFAVCVTCKKPIAIQSRWHWLNVQKRQAEHEDCYVVRHALEFPDAAKVEKAHG